MITKVRMDRTDYKRNWEQRNPDKVKEYKRRWYLKNKDKMQENTKRWRKAHPEQCREYINKYNLNYYKQLKVQIMLHYSNGALICAECGQNDITKLSIDHINGGGDNHRRVLGFNSSYQFYLWLKRNNYPRGYRVLCKSCNSKIQPPRQRKNFQTAQMIYDLLDKNGIMRAKNIVDNLKTPELSAHAILRALYSAVKKGYLKREHKGYYSVTGKPIGIQRKILELKGMVSTSKEYKQGYYQLNKQKLVAYQREYCQQNREKKTLYQQTYRQMNKKKLATCQREYYQLHKSRL